MTFRFQKKALLFVFASAASVLLFGKSLGELIRLGMHESEYTHLAVIPLVSGFFLWLGRKHFQSEKGNLIAGIVLIVLGAVYALIINFFHFEDPVTALSLKGIGIVLVIYGLFILCWGYAGFKRLLFPFIFLLLAIPFPLRMLNAIVGFLQWGSAVMVDGIFTVLGQTYIRNGVEFHLNSLSISIAPECSGIRSTMALIITGAVAVEMFLRKWWNKAVMLLLIVPMSLLKNAIRIVTITLLAQYVDMSFLTHSFLHKSGGIFFYLIVLALYFPLLFLSSKLETELIIKNQ